MPTLGSNLRVLLEGRQLPPNAYVGDVIHEALDLKLRDVQDLVCVAREATILSGTNLLLDLKAEPDMFGEPAALTSAEVVFVQSKPTSAGLLLLSAGPVTGWLQYMGASNSVILREGDFNLTYAPSGKLLVTNTQKVWELFASGGNCDVVVSVWGRR